MSSQTTQENSTQSVHLLYIIKFLLADDPEVLKAALVVHVDDLHDFDQHPSVTKVIEAAPMPAQAHVIGYSVSFVKVPSRQTLSAKDSALLLQEEHATDPENAHLYEHDESMFYTVQL